MKITKRQLRRIIREQLGAATNPVTVFDIVASVKRHGQGVVFTAYTSPRRDDRFEINDRWIGAVTGSKLDLFDSYNPRLPVATFDISNQSTDGVAKDIIAAIKRVDTGA